MRENMFVFNGLRPQMSTGRVTNLSIYDGYGDLSLAKYYDHMFKSISSTVYAGDNLKGSLCLAAIMELVPDLSVIETYKSVQQIDVDDLDEFFVQPTKYISHSLRLMLRIDRNSLTLHYTAGENQELVDAVEQISLDNMRVKANDSKISVVTQATDGLRLKDIKIKDIHLDLHKNYNDGFAEIDELIKTRIQDTTKGVILLHGVPGTGKTTYIRHLINSVKKRVIFIPPSLSHQLTDPGFITFLMNYPDSILIIEDAESVIMQRSGNGDNSVANLLNISDGLLSDVLNIQLLCTFNSNISSIDAALLRKGRVIAKYEFKELSIDKCNAINQELGQPDVSVPMTLSDLYNQEDASFSIVKNKIGFS